MLLLTVTGIPRLSAMGQWPLNWGCQRVADHTMVLLACAGASGSLQAHGLQKLGERFVSDLVFFLTLL